MRHRTDADLQALADEVIANLGDLPKERLEEIIISLVMRVKEASTVMVNMVKTIDWLCDTSLALCNDAAENSETRGELDAIRQLREGIEGLRPAERRKGSGDAKD